VDVSVNKSIEDFLRAQFQDWYSVEVLKTYDPSCPEIKSVKFPDEAFRCIVDP